MSTRTRADCDNCASYFMNWMNERILEDESQHRNCRNRGVPFSRWQVKDPLSLSRAKKKKQSPLSFSSIIHPRTIISTTDIHALLKSHFLNSDNAMERSIKKKRGKKIVKRNSLFFVGRLTKVSSSMRRALERPRESGEIKPSQKHAVRVCIRDRACSDSLNSLNIACFIIRPTPRLNCAHVLCATKSGVRNRRVTVVR